MGCCGATPPGSGTFGVRGNLLRFRRTCPAGGLADGHCTAATVYICVVRMSGLTDAHRRHRIGCGAASPRIVTFARQLHQVSRRFTPEQHCILVQRGLQYFIVHIQSLLRVRSVWGSPRKVQVCNNVLSGISESSQFCFWRWSHVAMHPLHRPQLLRRLQRLRRQSRSCRHPRRPLLDHLPSHR